MVHPVVLAPRQCAVVAAAVGFAPTPRSGAGRVPGRDDRPRGGGQRLTNPHPGRLALGPMVVIHSLTHGKRHSPGG